MKNEKLIKILKISSVILAIIFIVELVILGIKAKENRENTTYYTAIHSVVKDNDYYIGVGLSDFKYSKFNDYQEKGYNKAVIWKYDKNYNIVKEQKLDIGYEGVFTDVIKVKDGYVAVGYQIMSQTQLENHETEGIIVKYNENLELVWRKNIHTLDNTKLYSVILDSKDRLVIAGESIYGEGYVGNHTTGGAIILRYTLDGKKIDSTNYGGPYSDSYHSIIETPNGYIATGTLKNNTGFVKAYDKNLKEQWHYYSGYTDSLGITSVAYKDNAYYITGSKLEDKSNTDSYVGILIKLNKNGELEQEVEFKDKAISRLDKVVVADNKIYCLGVSGKKSKNTLENGAYLLEYNMDLKLEKTNKTTDVTTNYSDLVIEDKNILIVGYSNASLKSIDDSNGYDFFPLWLKYKK